MRSIFALLFTVSAVYATEPTPLFIEGYASLRSIAQGEEIGMHVSTTAAKYEIEVARLGVTREVVWKKADVPGAAYAVPEDASANGCRWPESVRVPCGEKWKSGYYEVVFRAADVGGKWTHRGKRTAESSAWFIVREAKPGTSSKILMQLCTNTYNAYNNWGGFSVYAYNSLSSNQGHRASFERPGPSQYSRWELPFVQWAEKNGYALEFAANDDLEFRPEILASYKLVLSVGHDEYWSTPMRDNLEAWIGKGGNVAFFSGNTCCWQVRAEDGGRAFTCCKQNYHLDPMFAAREFKTLSTLWSHELLKRPENEMTGVGFLWGGYRKSHGQFMTDPAEYEVHRPEHWALAGTGLKRGDKFGGKDTVVGYECDGCELEWRNGLPFPTCKDGTPKTFEVLATCPVRWHPDDAEWYEKWEKGRTGAACMGVYTRGGTVFTAATTDWSHGLMGGDEAVMKITRNVIERLGK
ncbi:N,N-dimethylformamidase beta subunit family domain-containing protein [Prosthecobacter sp.]|uniref:N,N-dimethylformamidase beta subunit family domain-containing protein n=1 Tax=Prosthecobacter sp. TaxID=1965333 RepID=UPI003783AE35